MQLVNGGSSDSRAWIERGDERASGERASGERVALERVGDERGDAW